MTLPSDIGALVKNIKPKKLSLKEGQIKRLDEDILIEKKDGKLILYFVDPEPITRGGT